MLRNKGQRTTETVGMSKHCPLVLCRFMPAEDLIPYLTGTRKTQRALQGSQHEKEVLDSRTVGRALNPAVPQSPQLYNRGNNTHFCTSFASRLL